jgi:hypothetical protein
MIDRRPELAFPGLLLAVAIIAEGGFEPVQNFGSRFEQRLKPGLIDAVYILPGVIHQLLQHILDMPGVNLGIGGSFDCLSSHEDYSANAMPESLC